MPRKISDVGVCALLLSLVLLCVWPNSASAQSLHFMAYNVLFQGADDAKSILAIVDEAPDVLCLTELTKPFVKAFEAGPGKDFKYQQLVPKVGTWGVGIASKFPLRKVRTFAVLPAKIPAMEATLDVGGRSVVVTCVHLVPPLGKHKKSDTVMDQMTKNAAVRALQADTLVARYADVKTHVLLGDFNEEPYGATLTKLEAVGWARGCVGPPCAATFPGPASPWPAAFVIDRVYARGLSFESAQTIRAGGSDHFPVSAVVSFNEKTQP